MHCFILNTACVLTSTAAVNELHRGVLHRFIQSQWPWEGGLRRENSLENSFILPYETFISASFTFPHALNSPTFFTLLLCLMSKIFHQLILTIF